MRVRGLSLVEVVVGMAASAFILTAAVYLMARTLEETRRSAAANTLARDAERIRLLLERDLRYAGLGVPAGREVRRGTPAGPALLAGHSSEVVLLGDLPAPGASWPTYSELDPRAAVGRAPERHLVAPHNEANGRCAPGPGVACRTGGSSVHHPGLDGCRSVDDAASPVCPWSEGRLRPGDRVQVVAADGRWLDTALPSAPPTGEAHPFVREQGEGQPLVVELAHPWPEAGGVAPRSGGFVTSLDVVTWRVGGRGLERIPCAGGPEGWDPQGEVTPSCQEPELQTSQVESFALHYLDVDGRPIWPQDDEERRRVCQVAFELTLRDEASGVEISTAGAARLAVPGCGGAS